MLDQRFRYDLPSSDKKRKPYDLTLVQDKHRRKRHILIVLQSVETRDIHEGELLSKEVRPSFVNAVRYAKRHALRIDPDAHTDVSYSVINFNAYRHLHLKDVSQKRRAEREFADRVKKATAKIKPTDIFVSGDRAMAALFPDVKQSAYKRGWVHKLEVEGVGTIPVTSTVDFARLLDKGGVNANLLGFWCRHFANLLVGRNPYDLSHIKSKPVYVNDMNKFKSLLAMLRKTKRVAIDTETRNLSVHTNKIYTAQFTFDEKDDRSYVVPMYHPKTPFAKDELRFIHRKLKEFFRGDRDFFAKAYEGDDKLHANHRLRTICDADELPELVFFNGMYDLRIIRQQFALFFVPHYVYEVTAGEHLLDENMPELKIFGTRHGNLRAVLTSYGNDFYWTASFSKEQRNTSGSVDPGDKAFLRYCAMDSISLIHIRRMQLLRASHERLEGVSYKPKFLAHMRFQMGDTAHVLSRLRQDGSYIDLKYLKHLASPQSPLLESIEEAESEFRLLEAVAEVNRQLLSLSGFKAGSFFGRKTERRMFDLGKRKHREALFFDKLGLEAVSQTPTGEPAIDKEFIAAYRIRSAEVDKYGDLQELKKLYTTYVRGWLKRIRTTLDGMTDFHLRPDYLFMEVATGRLASRNPSLQTIPTRSKVAKLIKRMFPAPPGHLLVRFDYSAHEVRLWAIVAGDQVLAKQFRIGQKLRQAYILNPTEENMAAIKKHGDLHLLNVKRFFNRIVDKDHPLRDAVKAVIFGAIYGKGAQTLGEDTKLPDIKALEKQISAERAAAIEAKRAIDKALVSSLTTQIRKIREEDRTDFAQDILDRLFKEFAKGSAWLEKMKQSATTDQQVYSPIGRIRHLYATMTEDKAIVNRQLRRGVNAPIQGIASEAGVKSARLIEQSYYYEEPVFAEMLGLEDDANTTLRFNRMVHDANYFAVPYAMVLPFVHILQKEATYGVSEEFDKNFGLKFNIEPEIEIEFVGVDSKGHKWNWAIPNAIQNIKNALADIEELEMLDRPKEEVLEEILRPWKLKDTRDYLCNNYPLLGVDGLQPEIRKALKAHYAEAA